MCDGCPCVVSGPLYSMCMPEMRGGEGEVTVSVGTTVPSLGVYFMFSHLRFVELVLSNPCLSSHTNSLFQRSLSGLLKTKTELVGLVYWDKVQTSGVQSPVEEGN